MTHKTLLTILVTLLLAPTAFAAQIDQVRPLLSYQGFLQINGAPVTGEVELIFRIYKSPTSSDPANLVWSESHTAENKIAVEAGHFSVLLGRIVLLGQGEVFLENAPLYLEVEVVTVNGASKSEVLKPRLEASTVPTAFVAQNALNIRGLEPVKFFEDKDLKVKSLTIDSGGSINCSGCISSTSIDTGKLAGDLVGSGLKLNNGKLDVDTSLIADSTSLGNVKTTADSALAKATDTEAKLGKGFVFDCTRAEVNFSCGTTNTIDVTCPSDRFVTGGGFRLSDGSTDVGNNGTNWNAAHSYPNVNQQNKVSGWRCLMNIADGTQNGCYCYAVCCKVVAAP